VRRPNITKLKRDSLIAISIPVISLGLFQIVKGKLSGQTFLIAASVAAVVIFVYLYRFFTRLDDMTWQQQLNNVIQKVTTPVLIADRKHHITYINDSFNHLPLAALLQRVHSLTELMAVQGSHPVSVHEMLDALSGRMKSHINWANSAYELVLVPLFSPNGKRWGTFLECMLIEANENAQSKETQTLPLRQMVEQLSAPLLFINKQEEITYVNLSFKMLLVRNQSWVQNNCPGFDATGSTDITMKEFLTLTHLQDKKLSELVRAGECSIEFADERYQLSFQPLWNIRNESLGTLVSWHDKGHEESKVAIQPQKNEHLETLTHATHPLAILDSSHQVQYSSFSFAQLLSPKLAKQDGNTFHGRNIIEIVSASLPKLVTSLQNALSKTERVTFISEHYGKICDWDVTPIKVNETVEGYILEVMHPSRQELKALEENNERLIKHKVSAEKELAHFTHDLAKLKLYHKDKELAQGRFNANNYRHPLLKNSAKIMQQLTQDLQALHGEIGHITDVLELQSEETKDFSGPMQQVNNLSSSIYRNVNEIKLDFSQLLQELSKLKGVIKEQKGLNSAYDKPINKAFESTEEALLRTVGYSETVTLVLHQIHENQIYLTQLQQFMEKLAQLPGNVALEKNNKIYQDIVALLDRVKNSLAVSKLKLKDLLINFESLKGCWTQALESLQGCLQLSLNVEQATQRWSASGDAALEYSQQVQERIQNLLDLAQKIQAKTSSKDAFIEPISQKPVNRFEHIAIEVNETKRKAEDVLLEGIVK